MLDYQNIVFDHRIVAAAPRELVDGVAALARARQQTAADLVREAVQNELQRAGVPVTRLPALKRFTVPREFGRPPLSRGDK